MLISLKSAQLYVHIFVLFNIHTCMVGPPPPAYVGVGSVPSFLTVRLFDLRNSAGNDLKVNNPIICGQSCWADVWEPQDQC